MNPIRHIVVPVDFSETSIRAFRYGLSVAGAFGAELTLLHVLTPAPARPEDVAEAKARLAALAPATAPGVRVEVTATSRLVEEELVRLAGALRADLFVMGTRGHQRLRRWMLGSTTERLLRTASVPLLTVSKLDEAHEAAAAGAPAIRRILYPTDFSDTVEIALPMAVEFAKRFNAELDLLHVVERLKRSPTSPPCTEAELEAEQQALIRWAGEMLDDLIRNTPLDGVRIRRSVREGRSAPAILEHAEASGADLIVISLHGMHFLERALLGATAERVVRAAAIPVLAVPKITPPAAE